MLVEAARGDDGAVAVAIDLAEAVLRLGASAIAVEVLVAAATGDATTLAKAIRLAEEVLRASAAADLDDASKAD